MRRIRAAIGETARDANSAARLPLLARTAAGHVGTESPSNLANCSSLRTLVPHLTPWAAGGKQARGPASDCHRTSPNRNARRNFTAQTGLTPAHATVAAGNYVAHPLVSICLASAGSHAAISRTGRMLFRLVVTDDFPFPAGNLSIAQSLRNQRTNRRGGNPAALAGR